MYNSVRFDETPVIEQAKVKPYHMAGKDIFQVHSGSVMPLQPEDYPTVTPYY
jgi:hypothetical protein